MVAAGVADWIVTRLEVLADWPTFWAVFAVALVVNVPKFFETRIVEVK